MIKDSYIKILDKFLLEKEGAMSGIFLDEDSPFLRAIHVHFTLLLFILARFQLLFFD
jgi:hypothetical protein